MFIWYNISLLKFSGLNPKILLYYIILNTWQVRNFKSEKEKKSEKRNKRYLLNLLGICVLNKIRERIANTDEQKEYI